MFLSTKPRNLSLPIPSAADHAPLVKSPGSYTSPEVPKSLLLGNSAPLGKDSFSDADYSRIDPDDMFAQYSVPEIRVIRARLLADADAKREELRQMVGERYRDLLHASTAITNMAGTSERVVGALINVQESCASILQLDESPRARHRSLPNGRGAKNQEDAHLKILQILSAHLKLLLDAPEHLWRWLEKRQFLHAAWLFLLGRTVHRKLSKSTEEEEFNDESEGGDISWLKHGIDVKEQFPIAERQWDAIVQFRPQIVHKATQALRESGIAHREVAETLTAILLLDALSIARTRSLFLSQRGKTLAVLFNPPLSAPRRSISPNRAQNRKATAALLSPASPAQSLSSPTIQLLKTPISAIVESAKAEKKAVKEVINSFRAVLTLIGGTVATVRAMYGPKGLLAQIISEIQTDTPTSTTLLPAASQPQLPSPNTAQQFTPGGLTTPQIVQALPSASLLLRFLPGSIVGYTPYISAQSSSIDEGEASQTDEELKAWLNLAFEALVAPAKAWLGRLDSVRAVWIVRSSVMSGILSLEGAEEVKGTLQTVIETAFVARVGEIWEQRLENVEIAVGGAINRAVTVFAGEEDAIKQDLDPLSFIYSAELPIVQGDVTGDSSFRQFEINLAHCMARRTPLLDSVVLEMEEAARELRSELDVVSQGEGSSEVATRLVSTYQPRAGEVCMRVVDAVSKALTNASASKNTVIFIGRLASTLASGSPFINNLSCSEDMAQGACDQLKGLHQESLRVWCDRAAQDALELYQPMLEQPLPTAETNISLILRPSNYLMSALRSLMSSIDSLGLTLKQLRAGQVTHRLVVTFKSLLEAGLPVEHASNQAVWDLMFVQELHNTVAKGVVQPKEDTSRNMIESHFQKNPADNHELVVDSVKSQLRRSQLLLSTLLGADITQRTKPVQSRVQSIFLPLGIPPVETDFRPALELVKPGQRFGMLPIAAVAHK